MPRRGDWQRRIRPRVRSPNYGDLYLPPQLGYLLQSLAVLGVTLLPYSASKDRQQGQPACHGAAMEFGSFDRTNGVRRSIRVDLRAAALTRDCIS